MNLFKRKTTWTNTEFIPLKLCVACAYILIGSYFPEFVQKYKLIFFGLFGITVIMSVSMWISKMKKGNS